MRYLAERGKNLKPKILIPGCKKNRQKRNLEFGKKKKEKKNINICYILFIYKKLFLKDKHSPSLIYYRLKRHDRKFHDSSAMSVCPNPLFHLPPSIYVQKDDTRRDREEGGGRFPSTIPPRFTRTIYSDSPLFSLKESKRWKEEASRATVHLVAGDCLGRCHCHQAVVQGARGAHEVGAVGRQGPSGVPYPSR